jgi:hypothetical protein
MAVYERFKAWQQCHELAVAVYKATKSWPRSEMFGLSSQARRAAHSAAANAGRLTWFLYRSMLSQQVRDGATP